jgi:uncharacterized protein (TIGR02996 family)
MTEEDALIAAIAANPDDDTPRLVYADWLDEHDRPVRAEFIRVQIDIARKEALPRVLQNRYVDVWKRNQELIDRHRDELLGPLAGLPAGVRVEFRRGFVSELTLTCDQLAALAGPLSAARPVPRVAVVDVVRAVRSFLGGDRFDAPRGVVTAIRTRENKAGDDDSLNDSPRFFPHEWPRLEELDISGCRLGDTLFALLAVPGILPVLADLDASVNDLTDAGVIALLGTPLPRQLKRLVLGGNPIGDQGAIELADRWPRGGSDRLEHLNLRFTNIGPPGQQALLARFGGRVDLF